MSVTWEDFPRKTDTIALLGFADTTREMAPWDRSDVEIFSVNEGYNFPWVKRFDRWLQIHPRWDFIRNTNNNDPNHFLWLKNQEGECVQCKGTGRCVLILTQDKSVVECPACGGSGHYIPPESRSNPFPIYMQKQHPDIPNSVAYPLDVVSKALIPPANNQRDYFTSSFSFMLGLAYVMGYKRVELYGFEMGADTEYHYQRANAEYLMGLVQGKGMEVYVPKASTLLTGPLYAYKSMKQGYRQNLEMRKNFLSKQLMEEQTALNVLAGESKVLHELSAMSGTVDVAGLATNKDSEKARQAGLVNGIRFAIEETKNLTKMYDNYFWTGSEGGEEEIGRPQEEVKQYVAIRYRSQ